MRPILTLYREMKKIILFLLAVFAAVNVLAQEQEEPIIITAPDTTIEKTAYSFTEQGITIAVSYGSAYPASHQYNNLKRTYFACLAGGSMTISAEQDIKGIAINGWVKKAFTATSDKGSIDYLSDDAEDTTGEPVLTISDIDAPSVTINCNNQLRCFSIEVYFFANPDGLQGEVMDTIRFTAIKADAMDYSDNEEYSTEGHYSYWLSLTPEAGYPQVWLDMYTAVKGDLSGEYSLYNYNVGDYTYVQLSESETDYEYAYDQEFTITKNGDNYHVEGYIIADNDVQYEFVFDGPIAIVGAEAIDNITSTETNSQKILRDGQLIIRRGNNEYTAQGAQL